MEAKSTDNKTFQLTENGELLAELIYENLFRLTAEIKLSNGGIYKVKPTGVFGTSVMVTKGEMEIAKLKMNWSGQIVLDFQKGQEYVLKSKGLFHNKYFIENHLQEAVVQFDPKFVLKKFSYNYDIIYEKYPQDILLVTLGVYAANYLIAMMTGASSGMG